MELPTGIHVRTCYRNFTISAREGRRILRLFEQALAARARIAELSASGSFRQPVVTQVIPATNFWKAEGYHQRYLEKRGMVSCHI